MKLILGTLLLVSLCACSEGSKNLDDAQIEHTLVDENSESVGNTPSNSSSETKNPKDENKPISKSNWSYKVTFISEGNWGYQLFDGATMVINQSSIPSIPGVNGFDSREKADKTAKHIIQKLEKGIFPPTVDRQELDSLGVLRN